MLWKKSTELLLLPYLWALGVKSSARANRNLCAMQVIPPPSFLNAVSIQGLAKRRSIGLVNFVTLRAYLLCLALPAVFTQPGHHLLAEPSSNASATCDLSREPQRERGIMMDEWRRLLTTPKRKLSLSHLSPQQTTTCPETQQYMIH